MSAVLRSLGVLGGSFAVVVAFTLGVALVMVPRPSGASPGTAETAYPAASGDVAALPEIGPVPTEVGGAIQVSGALNEIVTVDRELMDGRYGLLGDDARLFLSQPLAVAQMGVSGLSFYPEPEDCTITPGAPNPTVGLAWAELECLDLEDVRGKGTADLRGTLALPLNVLGMRDELPGSGGTLSAGEETLEFADAFLYVGMPAFASESGEESMVLLDEDTGTTIGFVYDVQTHGLRLSSITRDGTRAVVAENACELGRTELGKVSPQNTIIELAIECAAVEMPGVGAVPLSGTIVVEEAAPIPFQ